jgi:hypothetical protein
MTRSTPRLSSVSLVWLCAFLVSLVGCSPGDLPLAPNGAEPEIAALADTPATGLGAPSHPRTISFALSPLGLAKRTSGGDTKTTTKRIRARKGGTLKVSKGKTFASFYVPRKSLAKDKTLSMAVSGEGLGTVIEFGPSGTTFRPPAKLVLTFPADGIDPDAIVASLSGEDGAVKVDQKVTVRGNWIVIQAEIPHFSIYDPDLVDGEANGPPDPDGDGNP